MSVTYTALVFFGTFVERDSAAGNILREYIDAQGGIPAATGHTGVVISECSGDCTTFITVQISRSRAAFGRYYAVETPRLLVNEPLWESRIEAFLAAEQIAPGDVPPIGWYFAGLVSR